MSTGNTQSNSKYLQYVFVAKDSYPDTKMKRKKTETQQKNGIIVYAFQKYYTKQTINVCKIQLFSEKENAHLNHKVLKKRKQILAQIW